MSNFDLSLADSSTRNAITAVSDTATLFTFSKAPDLLLKKVSTFQEAIACGGVFLINGDRWQLVAGDVMFAALRRGVSGLYDCEKLKLINSYRRADSRWLNQPDQPSGFYSLKYGIVDWIPVSGSAIYNRLPIDGSTLVMGLVTKGHGSGCGMGPNENMEFEETNTVSSSLDIRFATPAPAMGGSSGELAFAVASYGLSSKVVISQNSNQYFKTNKSAFIADWVARGAPESKVMEHYVATYDAAVDAVYPGVTPLEILFTVIGLGSRNSSCIPYLINGLPKVKPMGPSLEYSGPSSQPFAPASVVNVSGRWYHSHLGFNRRAAGYGVTSGGLIPLTSCPANLKFGTVSVPVRELVGAVLPKTALSMSSSSGSLDLVPIVDEYTRCTDRLPGVTYSVSPTDSEAESKTKLDGLFYDVYNSSRFGVTPFLGSYLDNILTFGDVWDKLSKEHAEQNH